MSLRIGVDLGGTKIEAAVLDPTGAEVARRRVPTPQDDYGAIVTAVADLVEAVDRDGTFSTVGVGTPGTLSPVDGVMKNSNSTALNGRPLDRDLSEALGRPLRIANDADCFALSEARDGAGAGAGTVFGVILGTGVGGGLVVAGEVRNGPNRIAGEWGHNPLPWPTTDELPGPDCYCGKSGCIEKWLSGPGLAADHARTTGRNLSVPELVSAAQNGDAAAQTTLDSHAERLARSLATVVNIADPDVIVLGGGLSNLEHLYTSVPELLPGYVFGGESLTRLERNHHGDSSGVRGAAMLVPA